MSSQIINLTEQEKIILDELCLTASDQENMDIKRQLMYGALRLMRDHNDRLDLKLAAAAINEMSDAFASHSCQPLILPGTSAT